MVKLIIWETSHLNDCTDQENLIMDALFHCPHLYYNINEQISYIMKTSKTQKFL